ncbi:MAG: ROK family protein, partial [Bacilli bacterium]
GAVNNATGFIEGASAVPYIHGPNIREAMESAFGMRVAMENDANCAALAEVWKGAASDVDDAMFLVCGTGIGGAVIKNRKLHVGKHLHGGEFGYLLMDWRGDTLRNWSAAGSTNALVGHAAELLGVDKASLNGEQVFRQADEGNVECQTAIANFYETMCVGIFNLQYIYDPECIVIGGAISARVDLIEQLDVYMDKLLDRVKIAHVKPVLRKCKFANDANLLGAVYNAMTMEKK